MVMLPLTLSVFKALSCLYLKCNTVVNKTIINISSFNAHSNSIWTQGIKWDVTVPTSYHNRNIYVSEIIAISVKGVQ